MTVAPPGTRLPFGVDLGKVGVPVPVFSGWQRDVLERLGSVHLVAVDGDVPSGQEQLVAAVPDVTRQRTDLHMESDSHLLLPTQ